MATADEGTFHCADPAFEGGAAEMSVVLVLGGARSGKSRFAEGLAAGDKHYVATAQAFDDEMRVRISAHQTQRGIGWVTHEAERDLPEILARVMKDGRFVLVDCLTLWLSNVMLAEMDWRFALQDLLGILRDTKGTIVLVSNEVGMGLVPETPLGRAFRDAQGIVNQRVAEIADSVVFVAAGLPLALKGPMPVLPTVPS
jgi:adenosylcobinamide kinase / adenosylcobinamide-phosphate guanylyltransferase